MAPKASFEDNIDARRAPRAFKQLSVHDRMYAWKRHIVKLINYDAEGVILSKNNIRKRRRRRHPGRIWVPEGHLTFNQQLSVHDLIGSHERSTILINHDAEGVILSDT